VVKILQGSVVTRTTLGGLTTYFRVANFLQCIRAKNYDNWLAVDKVIAKIIRLAFLAHPVFGVRKSRQYHPDMFVKIILNNLNNLTSP